MYTLSQASKHSDNIRKYKNNQRKMENNAWVIWYPIDHSLSPKLHNYWLQKYNISGTYKPFEVKPDRLKVFLNELEEKKLIGVNVTVPLKEKAYEIIKQNGILSDIAKKTKAVNTIVYNRNTNILEGTNTDYYGFKNAFINQLPNIEFKNKTFLIIWAWWASKAIIAWLINETNNQVIVINRTKEKAEKLKSTFSIETDNLDRIEEHINKSDIIVNTTSCWLNGKNNLDIDFEKIKNKKVFYDIVYKPLHTKLLLEAKEKWHITITGIGMLIHQAVPAFELFFNKKPEIDSKLEKYLLN